jgi:predicted phosphoribosyltransferase
LRCCEKNPAKIIVAVPVYPTTAKFEQNTDEFIYLIASKVLELAALRFIRCKITKVMEMLSVESY